MFSCRKCFLLASFFVTWIAQCVAKGGDTKACPHPGHAWKVSSGVQTQSPTETDTRFEPPTSKLLAYIPGILEALEEMYRFYYRHPVAVPSVTSSHYLSTYYLEFKETCSTQELPLPQSHSVQTPAYTLGYVTHVDSYADTYCSNSFHARVS